MKKEDAEKLTCSQMSGPVCNSEDEVWIEHVKCETVDCMHWDDWGKEDERLLGEGDCGLRVLGELNVSI